MTKLVQQLLNIQSLWHDNFVKAVRVQEHVIYHSVPTRVDLDLVSMWSTSRMLSQRHCNRTPTATRGENLPGLAKLMRAT